MFSTLAILDVILVLLCFLPNLLPLVLVLIPIVNGGGVIIVAFLNRLWGKEKEQKSLLIAGIQRWVKEIQCPKIHYSNGKIVKVDYGEPQVDYPSETKKTFEKHNIQPLLKKAQYASKELLSKAETTIKEFHSIIGQKLKTLQLGKSVDVWKPLDVNTYSFPRICQAIFEEISGEKHGFNIQQGYLWHGDTKIARNGDSLNDLKSIVEKLIKDKELSGKVNAFIGYETKLDSEELFSEFRNNLQGIIKQSRWDN